MSIALVPLVSACGGAVTSGVAVGKVGGGLSAHAQWAPQGAGACALKESLAAPAPGADKPVSEACNKATKSDELWRRSMIVLAAYGDTLDAVASDVAPKEAGPIEAARTGVRGEDWIDVEDGSEKAARSAAAQLVTQMSTKTHGGDLKKLIKDAAPHVKTLCDGLNAYLEAQASGFAEVQKEVEKKRASRTDRRCGALDNRSFCVSESATDRVVYANVVTQLTTFERGHREAGNAVAGFCAAHQRLEGAAAGGRLSKDTTYSEIVEALKSERRAQPPPPQTAPSGEPGQPPKK